MIRIPDLVRLLSLAILLVQVAGTGTASSKCAALLEEFSEALQQRQFETLLHMEQQIALDAVCSHHALEVQRRRSALQLRLASEMIQEGSLEAEYEPLIVAADQPEVLWHASQALGNLRFAQRRFADAAMAYDRALAIIKNPSKSPTAPDSSTIQKIIDQVTYSRQLAATQENGKQAPTFVPAARNRDGTIGGVLSMNVRGFTPKSVPLPITFHTAQTTFTEIGEAAARELLTAILEQQPSTITIVGHADERGPRDYNLKLSADRAVAVKRYLLSHGVTANIATDGKGWTEPLKLPDDISLTPDEVWALNRRVEWLRE